MILIVDNGKGAQEIERSVRGSKQIVKAKDALNMKAGGIILSDGDMKHMKENINIIKKWNKPLLAIGTSYIFLASAYGAKSKEGKIEKTERVNIEHPCPLTLDLKRTFNVIQSCNHMLEDLPENFSVIASSQKYEFKIIGDMEKPFFGVHFNPELGGDGIKIIDNFVKSVDVWEKYHKGQ